MRNPFTKSVVVQLVALVFFGALLFISARENLRKTSGMAQKILTLEAAAAVEETKQ